MFDDSRSEIESGRFNCLCAKTKRPSLKYVEYVIKQSKTCCYDNWRIRVVSAKSAPPPDDHDACGCDGNSSDRVKWMAMMIIVMLDRKFGRHIVSSTAVRACEADHKNWKSDHQSTFTTWLFDLLYNHFQTLNKRSSDSNWILVNFSCLAPKRSIYRSIFFLFFSIPSSFSIIWTKFDPFRLVHHLKENVTTWLFVLIFDF